jgi:peptidoglycan/xylan/chitin deacetylase (PgdA/CDA1 family)
MHDIGGLPRIAVLAYHKVGSAPEGEFPTWNYVPESCFIDHLAYLEQSQWEVIDLASFLRGIIDPRTLPQKAVLLTFDDGYLSMVTVILPLLQRFGYPAVVFVPTGFVGAFNSFDAGIEPREPICSFDDLKTLQDAGISVQSHGIHHRRFSELSTAEREVELSASKKSLEHYLGLPVETFAFPYGDNGGDPELIAQLAGSAGYRAAFLYPGAVIEDRITEPYGVPRLAIGADSSLAILLS